MNVTICIGTLTHPDSNHAIFASEFRRRGDAVRMVALPSLTLVNGRLHGLALDWPYAPPRTGGLTTGTARLVSLEDSDLCWVMNQPHPAMAADVWQLLWNLGTRLPFVNDVAGLVFLNNKSNLPVVVPTENLPETCVSSSEDFLSDTLACGEGSWIVKPTNGGAGNNVFLIEPGGANARALLQSVTGSAATQYELFTQEVVGMTERHAVLQRYVPQARAEVQRVLVCHGEVIMNYGRCPSDADHRSNYTHGGVLVPERPLTDEERQLAECVSRALLRFGIRFAGLDMAYPYVLELNLANPGGVVNSPTDAGGNEQARRVIDLLLASLRGGQGEPSGAGDRDTRELS
ncbi:MAG TPA: hypothetical protein VF834_01895 [Streptosporangiaceae bacterium]